MDACELSAHICTQTKSRWQRMTMKTPFSAVFHPKKWWKWSFSPCRPRLSPGFHLGLLSSDVGPPSGGSPPNFAAAVPVPSSTPSLATHPAVNFPAKFISKPFGVSPQPPSSKHYELSNGCCPELPVAVWLVKPLVRYVSK